MILTTTETISGRNLATLFLPHDIHFIHSEELCQMYPDKSPKEREHAISQKYGLGKYQDQLLRLEDKLESGLYCELTDKTLHDGYIEYILLYDMIANRITIDEVRAENGCLRLMKNLVWEYDALPHALIAGGTGGGKTYFLLTLIEALLHTNAILYICLLYTSRCV